MRKIRIFWQNKDIFSTEIFYARYDMNFKLNYLHVMSNSNNKRKELSTKEDKLIDSTLFLTQDNKNKLNLMSELKEVNNVIEGLGFDHNQKSIALSSMKDTCSIEPQCTMCNAM